jgi:hypothetical protein
LIAIEHRHESAEITDKPANHGSQNRQDTLGLGAVTLARTN